ncbi:MAG: rhomboid family intramembrane serine protease [Pseudomonadota bacterium]
MPTYSDAPSGIPRPGKVVKVAMCVVVGLTLAFAVGIHWAGVGADAFELFCGNTLAILHGQLWRLFTASLLQSPDSLWPLLSLLMALYFFGVPLEDQWGSKRFTRILVGLVVVPSLIQALFDVALPPSVNRFLVPAYWYGGLAVSSGLAVAWALNHRGAVVRLYGILPITPRTIILLAVGTPFVYLLFRALPPEGIPGSLGGCFAGWLLAGGTPSPLRRYWLKFRIGRLDAEVAREAAQRKKRVERSRLKVIEGGLAKPEPPANGEKGRGPDGRWLN